MLNVNTSLSLQHHRPVQQKSEEVLANTGELTIANGAVQIGIEIRICWDSDIVATPLSLDSMNDHFIGRK